MSETSTIVRPSIEAIRALSIPCERVQSGIVPLRGGRRMHCASPGTPDIWYAGGLIECKMPGEKPTPAQLAWHEAARRWGVTVDVSYGLEQTIAIVKRWLEEYEYERAMGWK